MNMTMQMHNKMPTSKVKEREETMKKMTMTMMTVQQSKIWERDGNGNGNGTGNDNNINGIFKVFLIYFSFK